ncbi:sucraseferredoxin family protein [Knoellia sinensis KCTC 19936]|uniref:Sucraseferredoxin family protein n=1 Tax=Knoellia sinensis KCTC 19936 TaxID=1385520 RepID=A0A0A0JET5_9MICO|nr:sucrase ferredoxin [Knoellia sinensis]KGN34116.1 sucraseferredoxin family protein [Knoellia sinensis KCTC 19936]
MSPDTTRCSNAFRERGEPMIGSAPVARRWLLIEHPGPWSKDHLETPPIAGPVAQAIEAACAEHQGRSLLVRRTGRREPGEANAWYAVDTSLGTWVTGTWRTTDDLLDAVRALGTPLTHSETFAPPMLLVCTQGTRDACCALRGRPVTAALAKVWPDEVWECTHLSGHRFAGTFISMPDGTCYGMVDLPIAVEVVRAHRAGLVDTTHLRGLARYSPAVQAATGLVLAEHGPAAITSARPGTVEVLSETVTRVEVIGDEPLPDTTWVEVTAEALEPAPLSCGKGPGEHTAYRAVVVPDPR